MIPEETKNRLEEAAEKYLEHITAYDRGVRRNPYLFDGKEASEIYVAGAEFGYKEAIAQAKEWLKWHSATKHNVIGEQICVVAFDTQEDMLADFEAYMNKLWEDEK